MHFEWKDLIGKKFEHMGRGPDTFDCLGLVLEVNRRCGFDVKDPVPSYGTDPGSAFVEHWQSYWSKVTEPEDGDAVILRIDDATHPNHIGIIVESNRVLHATKHGVAVTRLKEFEKLRRVYGYVRPKYKIGEAPRKELRERKTVPCPISQTVAVTLASGFAGLHESWIESSGKRAVDYFPETVSRNNLQIYWASQCVSHETIVTGGDLFGVVTPGVPAAALGTTATGVATTGAVIAAAAINIAIATALSLLAALLTQPEEGNLVADENRPTFGLSGPQNTAANGTTIPVVYGEHVVAGQIIQLFYRANERFQSTLYMLVAVSEGEVQSVCGFTTDKDTIDSSSISGRNLLINGNPVSGFPSIKVSIRLGSLTQNIIPGFEETSVAGAVDVTLKRFGTTGTLLAVAEDAETYAYTTTNEIDAFEINIQFPIGLYKVDTSGDTEDYDFGVTLRWRIANAPSSADVVEQVVINGSYRGDHTRTIRRQVATRGQYRISMTRTTRNDEDTERRFSVSQVTTINEITQDGATAYPGLALVGIEAIATNQLSGSSPTVSSIVKGKKVYTWDGVSTTAPTLTYEWTDNPAWCAMDVAINKRYGLGAFLTLSSIDLEAFYDWAEYCDDSLTTDGVTHDRWQFDYVFDSPITAWDALRTIGLAGRAAIIYRGGILTCRVDHSSSVVAMFGMGNILAGSLKVTYSNPSQRPNFVEIDYINRDLDFDRDVAQLQSDDIERDIVKESIALRGITRPEQAYRAAKYVLNLSEIVLKSFEWNSPIDAVHCVPGDVVYLSDDVLQYGKSGRIVDNVVSVSAGVKLDQDLTVTAGDKIRYRGIDTSTGLETFVERTLTAGTYSAGTAISPTTNWPSTQLPKKYDVYSTGVSASYVKEVKIVRTSVQGDLSVAIEAVNYDATVYDDDPGVIETFTDSWPDSRALPENPTGLNAVDTVVTQKDGSTAHRVNISFVPDRRGEQHDIWFRYIGTNNTIDDERTNQTWRYVTMTRDSGTVFDIAPTYGKDVEISVCPRSPAGTVREPDYGARKVYHVVGKIAEPAAPTNLTTEQVGQRILLRWTPSTDRDVAHYEVRSSSTTNEWLFAQVIDACVCGNQRLLMPNQYGTATYLLIKAVNHSGIPSATPAYVAVTPSIGGGTVILTDTISGSEWTGSGTSDTNFTLTGSNLRSDSGATTATWTSDADGIEIQARRVRIHGELDVRGLDLVTTWDEAGFTWDSNHAKRLTWDGSLRDIPDPETSMPLDKADYTWDSPMAKTVNMDGTYDWSSNFKVLLEYDLATDSGATTFDGWKTYTGPFECANRYYVRWRVTFTNTAGEYQIELVTLQTTVCLPESYDTIDDNAVNVSDHFTNINGETGEYGLLGWQLSGTATATAASFEKDPDNHPGVVRITTNASASAYAALHLGTTGPSFQIGAWKYHRYVWVFNTVETADCTCYIGLADGVSTTTPTNRIWVTAAISGFFDVVTKDSGGTTTTTTTVDWLAGWYQVTIVINGLNSVTVTIANSSKSQTVTHTTTIPTVAVTKMFKIVSAAAAAKTLDIDYSTFRITGLETTLT